MLSNSTAKGGASAEPDIARLVRVPAIDQSKRWNSITGRLRRERRQVEMLDRKRSAVCFTASAPLAAKELEGLWPACCCGDLANRRASLYQLARFRQADADRARDLSVQDASAGLKS